MGYHNVMWGCDYPHLAVKHHCANMKVQTELATAAACDAVRAATGDDAGSQIAEASCCTTTICRVRVGLYMCMSPRLTADGSPV
jgi:hypothetical protein